MALSNAGRNLISSLLTGTGQALDNTHAAIGVGDSSTVFDVAQTDLQASTNKLRKGMDATYPTLATNVITLQSTFGLSDANWSWSEWAVFNQTSSGTMINRKVESLGTKLSSQQWVFQVQLTISN